VEPPNELLAAFTTGLAATLRDMAGVEAVRRDAPAGAADVTVALRLDVGRGWWAVLDFPRATAAALARRVLRGSEPDADLVRDCAAELLNVTSGQAKTLLVGTPHHFTFTTPTTTAPPGGAVVQYDSDCGPFALRLCPDTADRGTTHDR
jgi:CheY-specific phosphatase CheX